MFAVFKTGGKQYKVAKNDVVKLEKVDGDAGSVIVFDEVLAYGDGKKTTLGTPLVKDIKVSAEVLDQKKDDKVIIFKKKRRHNYRRKLGHRQQVTWVRINDIGANPSTKKSAAAPKATPKKEEAKPAAKKEEAKKVPAKKVETKKPAAKKSPAKKAIAKKPTTKKTTTKKK